MKRSKLLLGPLQKRVLYWATVLLWLTGAGWLVRPAPLWLKIHGAAAIAFLLVFGTLLDQHIPAGLRQEEERPSGVWLAILCGLLVLTGWGLYYFGNEALRQWTSRLHWAVGLVLPVLLFLHVKFRKNL